MNITDKTAAWFYSHVWLANAGNNPGQRGYVQKRIDYYNGAHAILDEVETYANGQAKGKRVMNWVKEIITRHVGSTSPFQVTQRETDEGEEGAANVYGEIWGGQRLGRIDTLLKRDVLLCGYAVEFHEFDGTDVLIRRYPPSEWAFLWDSDDNLAAAVRVIMLAPNSIHDGEVVTDSTMLMDVYTEEERGTFKMSGDSVWQGEAEPETTGRIPVVVWLADNEMRGIISDELIAMNDEFNAALNAQGDDIRNTVDALLKLWGIDDRWATENEMTIRQKRMLPFSALKNEQDAEYLQRALDIEPHTRHLALLRDLVHIMGTIPDVQKIIGASGSASGIALKLMFTPMAQMFDAYAAFMCEAIYERIDVIDGLRSILRQPLIGAVDVKIQFRTPTNRIEEWQNVGNLKGIVSHATQLELLSDIENPEAELLAVRSEEMGEDAPSEVQARIEANEEAVQRMESSLVDVAQQTAENIAASIRANQDLVKQLIEAVKQ